MTALFFVAVVIALYTGPVLLLLAWLRFFAGAEHPTEGRSGLLLAGIVAVSIAEVLLFIGASFAGLPMRSEPSIALCIRMSTVLACLGLVGALGGLGKGRVLLGAVSCLIPVGWVVAVAIK